MLPWKPFESSVVLFLELSEEKVFWVGGGGGGSFGNVIVFFFKGALNLNISAPLCFELFGRQAVER